MLPPPSPFSTTREDDGAGLVAGAHAPDGGKALLVGSTAQLASRRRLGGGPLT